MAHRPWFKFHPLAWRGDQALRQVSLAARGLWIELLCIMHDCEPYGHLVDKHERPMALTTIRNLVLPRKDEDVGDLLDELEAAGVIYFTKNEPRILFSKRMVEDGDFSAQQAEFGRKGARARYGNGKTKKEPKGHPTRVAHRPP